ncbi:MAG TPA: IS5 family transposase [Candidatus Limnocylindria bacterium]|nr:IS5 family transposase [Candidatus Limnocylindria bacterium]
MIELTNDEWDLVKDLFDPQGRRGVPARYDRREMVDAILFLARTGCQWRYLPARYPPWEAVWQQWRRWRENGVWAKAMTRLARKIREKKRPHVEPTMVMIDAQTVRGGRGGPTFHSAGGRGGRTFGTKRSILVEILGLPLAVRVDPAKPHDVSVGRELLADHLADFPNLAGIVADRGYRGLAKLAARRQLNLDIKTPPKGTKAFTPMFPLYKVEHAFAHLGRWRRLSRCYEGTEASARAWLEVASVGYLFTRLRAIPP